MEAHPTIVAQIHTPLMVVSLRAKAIEDEEFENRSLVQRGGRGPIVRIQGEVNRDGSAIVRHRKEAGGVLHVD